MDIPESNSEDRKVSGIVGEEHKCNNNSYLLRLSLFILLYQATLSQYIRQYKLEQDM